MRIQIRKILSITLGLSVASACLADQTTDARIALAKSAAPASIGNSATIVVDGKVVIEGSNGWTCMPDTMPGDGAAMCNDAMWMKMMNAVGSKGDFVANGIGISYMLQGDIGAGVSNATPYHPDAKNAADYAEMGPHLMIIVPREMLKGITSDHNSGLPYVMWGDTPYAHIMVPVGAAD